jgi:hypothetical protein
MKRRRKRNLFGKRNHYRRPTSRKLATGLENLERRALLTGLVGWGEVMDGEPGIKKEEVAFEKMSQKGERGHFEKQVSVNLKKLKMQKDQQERLLKEDRQATFEQADLDFADFEVPTGQDYQRTRPGISGDYHFERYDLFPGAWIVVVDNEPNEHHHQDSNENGRENINTFVYDDYEVTFWENPDGTIGEIMIGDDDEGNTDDGDTTSGSDGNPGTGSGSPTGGSSTYSGTSGGDDDIVNELETPPEEGDEDLDPGDPPVTEGEGEDGGEDSGETDDDDDDEDDENEEDDEEEDDGGNSGGGNESNANNDVVLLPTPLDEIIIEDDTGDDDDSGGGEDEGDDETIECPDPPPGGSAPTHPDC